MNEEAQGWWDKLNDSERVYWAAKANGADTDVLYAIEKPWKWIDEARKTYLEDLAEDAALKAKGI